MNYNIQTMQESRIITIRNLYKSYINYSHLLLGFKNFIFRFPTIIKHLKKKDLVLENISFDVYKGECFGIIGRNGAGKSTLLSIIAGVIKPDRGKVIVKGKVLPLLELGAGFHFDLSGLDNIFLYGILLGATRNQIKSKLKDIIEFSGIGDYIQYPLRTYSSGMIVRLAFSVIVHIDHDIILADEALAVGDINFQRKCINKMEELRRNGSTIVLVSHDMNQIRHMCNRAVWIENHKIKAIGAAKEITQLYERYINGK